MKVRLTRAYKIANDYWIQSDRQIVRYVNDQTVCVGFWAGSEGEAFDLAETVKSLPTDQQMASEATTP